ncbi:MAG: chromosomal replication initiator protein DnaA [Alphaproteobacteria bacterium]|nr:chromosomal replication initiator protein DnaA [Alphaproteobacteria bacterium]
MAELADRDALAAQWARVKTRLRSECGETAYRGWLKSLTLVRRDGEVVYLGIPSKFERDRVVTQYGDRLRGLWQGEDSAIVSVEVIASGRQDPARRNDGLRTAGGRSPDALSQADDQDPATDAVDPQMSEVFVPEPPSDLDAISAPLDSRFTFDNFVVGKPNELAFAAARRLAESETVSFNPLFLYGGVGLGKTHLMHAIAWEIRKNHPQRRVLYLSAEKFMYQFIRALRYRDTVAFKDLFRSVDVLMIDDVQFISGKDSTQEEFFHTFNALVDNNRQVVISADKSPSSLDGMEERLRSRLGWGLVADIHPTDYELRLGILQSKVERVEADIPPKVMEFLSHKISSNVRELEGALNRVVAHSTLVGRAITLEMVQEVLADILKANDRRVTIEEIQRQVASHYNIRISDMYSARRARAVARPRQIAMYLAKQLTQRSLPEIGRKFGGRDHTTVMHAVKKVDELRATDRHFDADVDLLRRMLEG